MKTCYVDVKPKTIEELSTKILDNNKDSILVMPAIIKTETFSPSQKKKYYRLKLEVAIPTDAIIGEGCLTDFGTFVVMRVPKNRVNPECLEVKAVEKHE